MYRSQQFSLLSGFRARVKMRLLVTIITIVLTTVNAQDSTEEDTQVEELDVTDVNLDEGPTPSRAGVKVEPTRTISTGSGPVRGRKVTDNGKVHYEFLGIPFAEPPLGRLRYKAPLPIQPWRDIFEAEFNNPDQRSEKKKKFDSLTPFFCGTR